MNFYQMGATRQIVQEPAQNGVVNRMKSAVKFTDRERGQVRQGR